MKKLLVCLSLLPILVCLSPNHAKATAYDLNYIIAGASTLTPTPSYGTVTLTDAGNNVDISLDLVGSTLKIHRFYLNYDGALFSNSSLFGITAEAITVDENNLKPGGYAYNFDLRVDGGGGGSTLNLTDTYNGTISLGSCNLDPANFDFTDTGGNLYVAVHIGNLPPGTTEGSIWVGGTPGGNGNGTPVPEPATMLLLGSGLIGLAGYGRKKFFKK